MKKRFPVLCLAVAFMLATGCGGQVSESDSGLDEGLGDPDAADITSLDDSIDELPDARSDEGELPQGDAVAPDSGVEPEVDPVLANTLAQIMQEHINFSSDPGMVLAVRTPEGAWWSGAVGMADLVDEVALQPDSQFRVGSNTKPIVAVVILQLVEEGKIDLDQPLTTYLPEYPEWSDITVRMLLNMRSGLNEFLNVELCLLSVLLEPTRAFTPAEIVGFVMDSENNGRLFEPDTDGYYSNTNYVLLGMIIEAVSDKTAEQEIQERILDPLGMTRTYLDDGTGDDSELVDGYLDIVAGGVVVGVSPSQAAMIPNVQYIDGLVIGTHLMHASVT